MRHLLLLTTLAACGPSAPMTPEGSTTTTTTTTLESSSSSTPTTTLDPSTTTSTSTTPVDPSTSTSSPATSTLDATFIVDPDGGSDCLTARAAGTPRCIKCDLFSQDCADGQKCSPFADDGSASWNDTKCVPLVPDPDVAGEACTVEGSASSGIDSCDLHSMCWDVDADTLSGTCVPFCTGSPETPTCPETKTCLLTNTLSVCLPQCDPLTQDCPGDDACLGNTTADDFVCIPGGDVPLFAACSFLNECIRGLFCSPTAAASECDPDANGCCLPFCDLAEPFGCPGLMQTCQPWFDEMDTPPPELMNVGFCSLP